MIESGIHMMRIFFSAILCTGLSLTLTAQAQINKCVDANGRTVYSQAPCPASSKSSSVRQTTAAPPPAAAADSKADGKGANVKPSAPKSTAELDQEFRKRRAEAEAASKKAEESLAESKNRDENCKSSKGQLAHLQ